MKLTLISDTHGQHWKVKIPAGDVLCHAGDFTMNGRFEDVIDFNNWLGELPHSHKLVIAGNHDISFERKHLAVEPLLTNCTYLKDSVVKIDGVRFYGLPWTPTFGYGWAFNADPPKMKEVCDKIPTDTDVLISHGPPRGILDRTFLFDEEVGSPELVEALERIKPAVNVFGHIHEAYGSEEQAGIKFYNASVLDDHYILRNEPFVVEI